KLQAHKISLLHGEPEHISNVALNAWISLGPGRLREGTLKRLKLREWMGPPAARLLLQEFSQSRYRDSVKADGIKMLQ
ncbi:Hypothetical predicted protein, partial [Podarcis lilfordi]